MTSPKEDQQPMTTREELVGHTPGPWTAASAWSSVVGLPVVAQSGRSVASVTYFNLGEHFNNHHQESIANSRLIAAAPMMFGYIAKRAAEGDEDARALLAEYAITKRTTEG